MEKSGIKNNIKFFLKKIVDKLIKSSHNNVERHNRLHKKLVKIKKGQINDLENKLKKEKNILKELEEKNIEYNVKWGKEISDSKNQLNKY